ncbi:MAG: type II secretion system F family protein, partial [Rhodoferax sp.]|nr:type II secretion system F family protein [Rhodoferax sp.]
MATAPAKKSQETLYEWEGKDRSGKIVKGEMRAGGEAMVGASLRRQGILVQKVKKRRMGGGGKVKPKDIAVLTRQLA